MANLIEIIDDAVRDLSEQTSPDITADFVAISQTSDETPKKVKLQNLVGTVLAALRSVFTPASASGPASLQLHEDTDNGTNKVTIIAPSSLTADRTQTLPDKAGTFAMTSDVDAAVVGLLDDKGNQDCSANPNYPAASKGDVYTVSVAGKIGGASGVTVEVGDVFRATADNAGGTQASVGTSWAIVEHNLVGPYIAGGTDVAVADGGTGSSTSAGARTNLDAAKTDLVGSRCEIGIACSDETSAITTGAGKATFRMPYAMTVTAVRASVTTAPTGSTILIDINETLTTILSTKLMIDATEKTSTTAATPYVISDSALADDAEITIDFDQVGATIAGTGVKVWLIGTRA